MDNPATDHGGPATAAKPALRVALRARRRAFASSATAVPTPTAGFRERLTAGSIVASYLPIGAEVDPAPFERVARAAGCVIALPHVVDRATPLRFVLIEEDGIPVAGPFGLRNPPGQGRDAVPDIILTPLLGFDRRGNRLGQGAGHYDRAFASCPEAWRVGLAWSVQEEDALPADPWDVPLHAIATEQAWIVAA